MLYCQLTKGELRQFAVLEELRALGDIDESLLSSVALSLFMMESHYLFWQSYSIANHLLFVFFLYLEEGEGSLG